MDVATFADQLTRTGRAIEELVRDLSSEEVRWKPDPERWSILEILCHLLDEEREDFRQRIDYTLHRPGEPWPGIDPQGWVSKRRYAERDLEETVRAFRQERARSVVWLKELGEPAWDASYQHPRAGTLRAGDLMASWLAHDLLHIRQIVRMQYDYLDRMTSGYGPAYAGRW